MAQRIPGIARRFGEVASLPLSSITVSNRKNILINGSFVIDQRRGDSSAYDSTTTPANNDDTYLLDQWILLSDGNDVVDVTQELVASSDIPADSQSAIKLDVETANKKFGIFQPIETHNCNHIDSQIVSLSFKVKAGGGSTISNIRAGIVHFTSGTGNVITSDIVSAWEAAGTDPTLIANWSYANTPANIALTTSYQTVKIENITVGTVVNAGVFIWVDDTDPVAGEFVFISDVQLETGSIATSFDRRTLQEELFLCSRYFQKTLALAEIPAQSAGLLGALLANTTGSGRFGFSWDLESSQLLGTPTLVTFNPSNASADARNVTDSAQTSTAVTDSSSGTKRVILVGSSVAAGNANDEIRIHVTAESVL